MRPYFNISESELETLGVFPDWDKEFARALPLPARAVWVHAFREKRRPVDLSDPCGVRSVTILAIRNDVIKTDFGSYALDTGKNLFRPCGCKRSCDCYGQLYLLKTPSTAV